jgi:hypothetical protein
MGTVCRAPSLIASDRTASYVHKRMRWACIGIPADGARDLTTGRNITTYDTRLTIEIYDSIPGVGPDAAESLWGIWVRFLDGGGRYALALGAALFAADVQNRLRRGYHAAQHDLVAATHAVTQAQ